MNTIALAAQKEWRGRWRSEPVSRLHAAKQVGTGRMYEDWNDRARRFRATEPGSCLRADNAINLKAVGLLKGAHRRLGLRPKHAVDRADLVIAKVKQALLDGPHIVALQPRLLERQHALGDRRRRCGGCGAACRSGWSQGSRGRCGLCGLRSGRYGRGLLSYRCDCGWLSRLGCRARDERGTNKEA